MEHALARWAVLVAGLTASAAIAWSAIGFLHSPRGIPGPGAIDASSPVSAAAALLIAFILATVVAVIVGRLLNPVVGLFTLGAGLGVLAMRSGTIRDAAFDGSSLVPLAIEGLVWSLLVMVASILVHRFAREEFVAVAAGGGAGSGPPSPPSSVFARAFEREALMVAAIGAVAIIGIWLMVTSAMKGQSIGAAVVGGFIAGHVSKRALPDASPVLLFATPILFVALAQLILAMTIADPASAFVHGSIPNLVVVMPLDLVSGSIVGVAIGIGMAKPSH